MDLLLTGSLDWVIRTVSGLSGITQAMKLEVAGNTCWWRSINPDQESWTSSWVTEEMDEAEDLEQDLLSQLEEYRTYKQLGELMASYLARARPLLFETKGGIGLWRYWIASWSHHGGSLLSSRNYDQEKRIPQNHTTIVRMNTRLRIWWTSCVTDSTIAHKFCRTVSRNSGSQNHYLALATLELIRFKRSQWYRMRHWRNLLK